MKMLAKFSKTGDLKYCSHLDMQKLFMRAVARAKAPVAFSQGFNRHPNMSVAMALGVGQESISEYLEIDLTKKADEAFFLQSMNEALPKDVRILACKYTEEKLPPLMSVVFAASYEIVFKNFLDLDKKTDEILNKSAIIIDKKTKSKLEPTDIRPMILNATAENNKVLCTLRSGSVNLKPADFAALYGEDLDFGIVRTGLYFKDANGVFKELIDII